MRKQIQTAELRIMMQKDVTCKKQAGQRREICPACFFLPVGEMKKCTEKEQKNEKICKNFLHFREQNAIL